MRDNAQMHYRYEIEHAPASLAPAEGRTVFIEGHAQMQYRYEIEHAPANFAFVAVLTSSFALLAFSKYRRAQTTPIIDPYCFIRFSLLIATVLPAAILIFLFFSFCFSPIQFDVEDRHLPNRQITAECSLLWDFSIVIV